MRFAANSSPSLSSSLALLSRPTRLLRAWAALALVATLAACGGDGGGTSGTTGSGVGTSAKPDATSATTTDETSSKKDGGEVRYAP